MEWIDGTKLTNLEDVKKLGINPDEMIDIGVQCSLEQLLEHGFFHADPHPGNLLALNDGRLCYLDFGMMSEVSRESRSGLMPNFFTSFKFVNFVPSIHSIAKTLLEVISL